MPSPMDAEASPRIEALFAQPVAAAELMGEGDPQALFDAERSGQQRWARKRVLEFAAGRQCAHQALRRLGVLPEPLLSRPDRRPEWPRGIVGSISHCRGFSVAVVARSDALRSLGVDVEVAGAVEPALWPRILTAAEQEWLEAQPAGAQRLLASIVFSAKESFYKCQYGVTERFLEFGQAWARVEGLPRGAVSCALEVSSGDVTLAGCCLLIEGWVCTAFGWPA
ncbi:MAG: 4'-phosphopantetheinyl transferase superfamily protein [Steroidobacteraceae bacterium]